MQSMLVSQQQLMRRKTNDFMALPNLSTRNTNNNGKYHLQENKFNDLFKNFIFY